LEKRGEGKFADVLQDIKNELRAPFKDKLRKIGGPLDPAQLFSLLTGEIVGLSIRAGQLVTVRVVGISSAGVRVRLDSDISGFIPLRDLTDDRPDHNEDVLDMIRRHADVGRSIKARITDIVFENFEVRLSSKSSDIQNSRRWEKESDDVYTREFREYEDDEFKVGRDYRSKTQSSSKEQAAPKRKRFTPRPIVHINFQNISREEAEEFLSKHREDFVIRPSSKGISYLTVTWKVSDDLFAHIEVEEQEKGSIMEEIGQILIVNKTRYESLDEIIATYLRPMIANMQRVVGFRKFRVGRQLDMMLRAEKEGNPASIPYLIGYDYEHPGFLTLGFLPASEICRESIKVNPEGYVYRKQNFKSITELVNFFKSNALSSGNRGNNGPPPRQSRGFSSHGPPPMPYAQSSHRSGYDGYNSRPTPPQHHMSRYSHH
jgi:transcription elongation factor SPT6